MTTPSLYQQTGISIVYSDPLWLAGRRGFIDTLTNQFSGYNHVLNAFGGYWEATFDLPGKQVDVEDWFSDGIGRHIEAKDDAGVMIFRGFVNQVVISLGGLSVTRGPLVDIANRLEVVYSTVDNTVSPPVAGVRAKTAAANDTTSQARYGIIHKVLSGGGMTAANALQTRDTYISDTKDPAVGQTINSGQSGELTATITVFGYVRLLDAYTYNTSTTGNQNASAKIMAVIAASPNTGIFSADTKDVTTNTYQVAAWEDEDRTGMTVIKGIVSQGDATSQRYTFGIYADGRVKYAPVPATVEYQWRISNTAQEMTTITGGAIKPWNILPCRWCFVPDFLVGRSQSPVLRQDPRMIFIESARYTAPFSWDITGGKVDTISQKLAQLGLGGISG